MKKIMILLAFLTLFMLNVCTVSAADSDVKVAYDSLAQNYKNFINVCNSGEKLALIERAHGSFDALNGSTLESFSSLTTENGEISYNCADAMFYLYDSLVESGNLLYGTAYNAATLEYVKLFNAYHMNMNVFVGGDRTPIPITDSCSIIDGNMKDSIDKLFLYVEILLICLTVVISISDLYKVMINGKSDYKKAFSGISKRVIVLIVLLLLPLLIDVVIDVINSFIPAEIVNCLKS